MIVSVKTIRMEIAIESEIAFCLSDFKQGCRKFHALCLGYEKAKDKNELEDWEHEYWQKSINSAFEELQHAARILVLLENCYPEIFLQEVKRMKISNDAWNALISALNVTNGDSKQAKALFEMWLTENYYPHAYKEGWLECCDYNDIDYDGYLNDDDGDCEGDLIYDGY